MSRNSKDFNEEESYAKFLLSHEARLRFLDIPECKWRTLSKKLYLEIFDSGKDFMYANEGSSKCSDNNLRVYACCAMSQDGPEDIYLIDHAWTYTLENAKTILRGDPMLLQRMKDLMKISAWRTMNTEQKIRIILTEMWQYNNFYVLQRGNQVSNLNCWYILDEFGSRIRYSDAPSFKIVPFYFSGDNSTYSLLFPITSVSEGDEVTVAYPGYSSSLHEDVKKAIMYPWTKCDLSDIGFNTVEPPAEYFASGRQEEILPEGEFTPPVNEIYPEDQLKVYSCYVDVKEFLNHPGFKIVENMEEANILWLSFREYNIRELVERNPNFCFINQFPSEHVLVNKDLLALVCQRCDKNRFNYATLQSYPDWLPTTYNLKTELHKFVCYFQNREAKGLSNIWILKPFNLARGMNIRITDNLSEIIRLSLTGPMVACLYIHKPVLFPIPVIGFVKMDLRYIVLLSNIEPFELYVYDRFWIRFANKRFDLKDLNDYEKHFTVMNYSDFLLKQMFCDDFIKTFEACYKKYKWQDIQDQINKMIKEVFVAAASNVPPAGLGVFVGSRAVYGLDIMLQWQLDSDNIHVMKPVLLEVNWMPDCKRACQYYPGFYNDIFSVMFLGEKTYKHVTKLF